MAEKKNPYEINGDELYSRYYKSQSSSTPKAPTLTELYGQIQSRPDFQYDVSTDPLYQQYKDRYIQLGKTSMKDTMGQAAALTGGYGSSYAQGVGQQAYDRYMQGLSDKVPELYSAAYSRWQDEGNRLMQQYGLAKDVESTAYGRQQDSYQQLYSMILSTGYQPTDDELAAANMPRDIANRLRTIAIMRNEDLGMIDANGNLIEPEVEETPVYGGGSRKKNTLESDVAALRAAGLSSAEINKFIVQSTVPGGEYAGTTVQEKAAVRDKYKTLSR